MEQAFIVEAFRTAGGRRGGKLAHWHPADLAAEILNALVGRTGVDPHAIEDVIFGCVSQVGEQSWHIARNAVLASALPDSVPAVTIDRQCGSSQQALHFAAQAVASGTQDLVIAGGVESMTRVPIGSPTMLALKANLGGPWSERILRRYGVAEFSQFTGAQRMADKYGLRRVELDEFAVESHLRAAAATRSGAFEREIVPIALDAGHHRTDEGIRSDASLESIGAVKLLKEGGTLTAANASQICDGASAALIVNERALKTHGLTPLARIHQLAITAGDPVIMLEEPIPATRKALDRCGLSIDDIDLFEVNEAFAAVVLRFAQAFDLDMSRINVNGGAIALGHPLGATGAMILGTALDELERTGKSTALVTLCIGGGMGTATIIERV